LVGRKVSLIEKRYTTKKYSRRFGMPFQGKVNIKKGDIAIAIDTSGSITDVDMNEFLTRIYYIAKMWKNSIRILIGDCEVYTNILIRQPRDVLQLKIEGGGGTSSKPFFEQLRRTPPCLLIFFTDLYTDYPDEMPPFPVLWATENMNKDVPFGKKFKIELERKSNA
jgi:predicted metal-dependent peptidase